ncbi:MAG TPA: ATP-binding cassette domain-containing protein [Candidatus Marinimicrobia bacterium]|nr:ATP-binding cassette domain-containing protein [Candidatus Neomarinimicrobiota bacterium]
MIACSELTIAFGQQILFKDVSIKFSNDNCYGLIGANGSGKSTFLRALAGEQEIRSGQIHVQKGKRIATLRQDHFAFDEFTVMQTALMGHKELYDMLNEKELLEVKDDITDLEGMRLADLYGELAELDGYEAESEAGKLLDELGVSADMHHSLMENLESGVKVRVLLVQALFGNPDILLLDEPTNNLDLESIAWLEEFLYNFQNTVIVVSHDRHFLNRVCTHIADIDYKTIRIYAGNYDFWYQATQLAVQRFKDEKRKREDKIKDLEDFIARFSANASKARQATSRKKLVEKLTIEDMPASSRKHPFVEFKASRNCGKSILKVTGLNKSIDGEILLKDLNFSVENGDKIIFVGANNNAKTALFDILTGKIQADSGSFEWGVTITASYMPRDNADFFLKEITVLDWLRQFATGENTEQYLRGFLGRMLFSGDDVMKKVNVLSGGERVRCLLSRSMLSGANVQILDEPTNHLDLEAISAVNEGMIRFPEIILFGSHDHELNNTVANRVIELTPNGMIDRRTSFDEYFNDPRVRDQRNVLYRNQQRMVI